MKLNSIQYLRAVAAVAVVMAHSTTALFDNQRSMISFDVGGAGVDLFFVISGFIMFYTTDGRSVTPLDFYTKRLVRVVPLYLFLSTLAFAMAALSPGSFNTFSANIYDYIRSILFIPFYNTKVHDIRPEIGQGWTLNYEMFFYVIFGVGLIFARNLRLLICWGIFSALSIAGSIIRPGNPILATYTDSIMLEFMFGMTIGYFMAEISNPRHRAIGIGALVLGLCGVAAVTAFPIGHSLPRFLVDGLPAAAVVAGALWLDRNGKVPEWPVLLLIGDASYSLYLAHGFALGVVRRIWARLFDINLLAVHASFIVVATVAAILLSIVVFKGVEKPLGLVIGGLIRRGRRGKTPAPAGAA